MTIETIEALDEMRARALASHDGLAADWKAYLDLSRAIRLADDTAEIVSVPKEATEKMKQAGNKAGFRSNVRNVTSNVYDAMLSASPFAVKP